MPKYASLFTAAAFLIIPFVMMGSDIHQAHVYGLILAAIIGLALYLPNPYLSGFGLYAAVWLAYVFSLAFVGMCNSTLVLVTIDGLLFIILGMLVFLAVYHSQIETGTWANVLCTLAIIQATIGICQHFWFDPLSTVLNYVVDVRGEYSFLTPIGTLGNKNFLGALLAISLPFFFRARWWFALPVIALGLFIVQTSTAVLAACIGAGYFFAGWRGAGAMIVPGVLYFVFIDSHAVFETTNYIRFLFWEDAIIKVLSSWKTAVFGFGPGITWEIGNQLHNEYVATLFNYGLVGLTLMVSFILNVSRASRMLFTAFIILCVNMIGNHPLHTTPTALLAITIIALIEREATENG
jgi:hypothetical protein